MQIQGDDRDRQIILSPENWPQWPVLPLKHNSRKFHDNGFLGFLLAEKVPPYVVYVAPIYALTGNIGESCKAMPKETYDNIDALIVDWRVD